MKQRLLACLVLLSMAAAVAVAAEGNQESAAAKGAKLRPVSDFDTLSDPRQRSMALFQEAGKVLQHPRCLNCHPRERAPTQGDDLHPHNPPVSAGSSNHGVPGMPCSGCHGVANVATPGGKIQSIPGHPHWSLAPVAMAWSDQTLGEICEQVKDPLRNGGRSLEKIHEHMAQDTLVGWAWQPGEGRVPAPGTQAEFGALIKAWIDSGAVCPTSG